MFFCINLALICRSEFYATLGLDVQCGSHYMEKTFTTKYRNIETVKNAAQKWGT
jgi:hypothetical protein